MINLTTNREDLLKEYNNCDFPSHSEGMPKALLEAMSCGCPVICSDISPHKEDAHNGLK
ncbi:MAG: glycosyltransferase [Campylobacterota bacterium]